MTTTPRSPPAIDLIETMPPVPTVMADAQCVLAAVLLATGRQEEGREWFDRCDAVLERSAADLPPLSEVSRDFGPRNGWRS